RRGTGSGEHGGKYSLEKCSTITLPSGQIRQALSRARGDRQLKHAKQVQCESKNQAGNKDDKPIILELKTPPNLRSRCSQKDDKRSQNGKTAHNPKRECHAKAKSF